MIGSHKASRLRDIIGVGLCALVGAFALTKAPVSVAELVSDAPISMNFVHIPVSTIVRLIADGFGPRNITGLEQLGDTKATVRVTSVPAREVLQRILNCAGFAYRESGEALAIVPSGTQDAAAGACGSVGMKLEAE